MFEVNSVSEISEIEHLPTVKASKTGAKPKTKSKPQTKTKNFPAVTAMLSNWDPSDSMASRSLLISEIIIQLEKSGHKCTRACIPALIVDEKYPLELMHYRTGQGLDEFMTRMLWMNEEYQAAIGILVGVPDDKTSASIEEACEDLFSTEKNCIVILL
jgi:hypothetical protein